MRLKKSAHILYISLGWLSLALGFIGAFLPILPTTPFALLAAYFFSKGSPKLHQWLLENKLMGPLIRDWEQYGVVRLRAKITATLMIVLLFSYTLIYVEVNWWIKALVATSGAGVLIFLWTRPATPKPSETTGTSI